MAAEAALVAEELGKIVSAQQIFVLRKAIYRLTAHSTNPHAVLYAHLPLRSASGALRQRNAPKPLSRLPRLRSASGALRQSTTYSHSPVWYPLRSARGALRQRFRFLLSGQAEPRSAFCRRSGRQAPHPGILCHAVGGRLRDPRGDRGDQRLPPPSEKMEGDDNSAEDEALARQIEEQHRERVSPFAFSKCGISEGAELEFCCRGNEQPASAAPSPTTSMCAFRTKYGP